MVPTRWRRWLQFCWSENNRLLDPVFFLRSVFPLQNLSPLPDFFECFFDPQRSFGNPLRTFRQYLASPVLEKSRFFLLRRNFPPYYARTSRMPPRVLAVWAKTLRGQKYVHAVHVLALVLLLQTHGCNYREFEYIKAWFPYGRNCREPIEMADVKQCITVLFHLSNTHLISV